MFESSEFVFETCQAAGDLGEALRGGPKRPRYQGTSQGAGQVGDGILPDFLETTWTYNDIMI